MPKMKATDFSGNLEELEEAEYEKYEKTYTKYEGEIPPEDTVLRGYVRKAWYALTQNDDDMLIVLFVADGNTGDEEEFNGLPIFERMALIKTVKFKWQPFFDATGLSIREVFTKTVIADEDDNMGAPIEKIGKWEPGEDNENAWVQVITGREKYKGEWQARVGEWLPYEAPEDAEEEPEEEPETEDETEPEESEEEPEKPATPARTRSARTAKATPARSAPATTARRGTKAAAAKPAATARRGARNAKPEGDDPPF